jgi:hypothetical protein
MQLKIDKEHYGKLILIGVAMLMWLLIIVFFKIHGYRQTWELWGIKTESMAFMDFRLIPGSAESFRNGYEPSIENPFEPGGRIFNYPAFWRLFFYTNITQNDTVWIGTLMIILFFIGVVLFPQNLSVSGAFWTLLIVFSPACMLLYERGNVDLFIFFICVLIILATGYSAYLTAGLLVFGAVVKIFPFFGIAVLLRESKRRFTLLTLASASFVLLYSYLTFESQRAAWNTTMRGTEASYGTFVLLSRFASYFQSSFQRWMIGLEVFAVVLILIAMIPAVRAAQRLLASYERNLTAFRMGASIYMGTFLLGNNWDYRLAFLILVIPQLTQWFYLENKTQRSVAIATMIGLVLACWHFVFLIDLPLLPFKNQMDRIVVFDDMIHWLLLPGFSYLLAASFLVWLKQDLQKVFGAAPAKQITLEVA